MARSRCHSNGVSRARAPIASCPSVRRRLSDRPTEHLPCVFLIWAIWGTFHARFVTQPTLWAPNISQCGITTRGQWPYYRLDGIGNNFERMFALKPLLICCQSGFKFWQDTFTAQHSSNFDHQSLTRAVAITAGKNESDLLFIHTHPELYSDIKRLSLKVAI